MTTLHSGAEAAKLERLILKSPVLEPLRQWLRVSISPILMPPEDGEVKQAERIRREFLHADIRIDTKMKPVCTYGLHLTPR